MQVPKPHPPSSPDRVDPLSGQQAGGPPNGSTAGNRSTITACIVCRNEADKLGPCLESVAWADEVIVVDLSSTDDSAAVARRHGARLLTREPIPIVEPVRDEVASIASGDWILALDPDERVAPRLAHELRRLADHPDLDAVVIPRMNVDLGFPPSNPLHRYEPQLRMYRRSRVSWPVVPNALPQVSEDRLHRLPPSDDLVIVHERNRTIPEVLDRVVRYAPAEARSMADRGQVFSANDMAVALGRAFHKQFIWGQPWKDGVPGMLRASILVAYKFYVWAAFWQVSGGRRTAKDDAVVRRVGVVLRALGVAIQAGGMAFRPIRRIGAWANAARRPRGTRARDAEALGSG